MYEKLSIYAFDRKFKFTVDLTALHRHKHKEVTPLPLLIMRAYVLERPLTVQWDMNYGGLPVYPEADFHCMHIHTTDMDTTCNYMPVTRHADMLKHKWISTCISINGHPSGHPHA